MIWPSVRCAGRSLCASVAPSGEILTRIGRRAMPMVPVAPAYQMYYEVDDFTDPWETPATILLLHGNAESGDAWYGWVPHLARRFRVVRPDMRGFGRSSPMPREHPWTLDALIVDYVALMD